MDLEADDLVLFAQVAEHGSFARAAAHLRVPKSTVSRRIAALEERLGERLMLRDTRRLTITDFGLDLLRHARRLKAELGEACALASAQGGMPRGRMRISAPPQLAETLLAPWLMRFAADHPEVELVIDTSVRPVDMIAERFDLALRVAHHLPDDARLVARRVCELHAGLYASTEYLARGVALDHPRLLAQHASLQYLIDGVEGPAWQLHRGDECWQAEPAVRLRSNSATVIVGAALQGLGIAVLESSVGEALVAEGRLRRVLPAWTLQPTVLWAVTPGRRLLAAGTRALLEVMMSGFGRRHEAADALAAPWRAVGSIS